MHQMTIQHALPMGHIMLQQPITAGCLVALVPILHNQPQVRWGGPCAVAEAASHRGRVVQST